MSWFKRPVDETLPKPGRSVTVIGEFGDEQSSSLTVQDFMIGGESVIPIFSSTDVFREQTAGTPYSTKGIGISLVLLQKILRGNEILTLDPASDAPRRLTVSELALLEESS